MDFDASIHMSASGLTVQRQRMNVIASNIANVHATRTSTGEPYRRRDVVIGSEPLSASFQGALAQETLRLATVAEVRESRESFRQVYEPSNPDANAKGYVNYPNVNLMEEMVKQMLATNAYQANLSALNSSKNMALRAMEIGR